MKEQLTGIVYDIQGFSVQDGPGIRTTVFLKGCPLRCPWCHSPESQQFHNQLSWISMRCAGISKCGNCLGACSKGALSPGDVVRHATTREEIQHVRIDRDVCDNCGDCENVCYHEALYICGKDYTVDELVQRVSKDIPFYETSGGGVTISGGEPLSQLQFTKELLEGLKAGGIHTALDTTGFAKSGSITAVLPFTDLFLYDLKHMDSDMHQKVTGVPNDIILENARNIARAGGSMQIRVPVIPGFNDSEKQILQTGAFCQSLGEAVTVIQLLPYHNLGVMKYQRINNGEEVLEAKPPSDKKINRLKQVLEDLGLPVTVH